MKIKTKIGIILLRKKLLLINRRKNTKRACWIHPINKQREALGLFGNLIQELKKDNDRFFQYFRMSVTNFNYLLTLVAKELTKIDTFWRPAIKPDIKLAITLHHLAEGASLTSIAFHYRLGKSTVCQIVYDACKALYKALQPLYLQPPSGVDAWKKVADG